MHMLSFLLKFFCLGTGVPRHSAGGVGSYVRTYVRGTWYVSENSITRTIYSSEHIFIALRWCSETIMGFHENTYQVRGRLLIVVAQSSHLNCRS